MNDMPDPQRPFQPPASATIVPKIKRLGNGVRPAHSFFVAMAAWQEVGVGTKIGRNQLMKIPVEDGASSKKACPYTR
jgi:hypothetical protein